MTHEPSKSAYDVVVVEGGMGGLTAGAFLAQAAKQVLDKGKYMVIRKREEIAMCEFCTEHGEGKKWYLQMKNHADELLYEELSSAQKDIVGATTRLEWNNRFWETFMMPAITGEREPREESQKQRAT